MRRLLVLLAFPALALAQSHEQNLSQFGLPIPANTIYCNSTGVAAPAGTCAAGANITISGGAISSTGGGGGGSPGGSNTNVQYNNGGNFGGLTYPQFQANLVTANAGVISATGAAGTTYDYSPTGWGATVGFLHLTPGTGGTTLGGLVAGSSMQVVFIDNAEAAGGADNVILLAESASDSTAANRFHASGNLLIPPGARVVCLYDSTTLARWSCQ
jgi:hypothetical protein